MIKLVKKEVLSAAKTDEKKPAEVDFRCSIINIKMPDRIYHIK